MAVIHYITATGNVSRVLHSRELQEKIPAPGAGEAAFEFDETTNAATSQEVRDNPGRFTLVSGQIRKDGTPVSITADSPELQERNDFDAQLAAAITRCGQIKTAADAGMTNAQRDTAIGDLAVILRRHLKLTNQLRKLQR